MRVVSAANGWAWLKQGWTLFRKRPTEWLLLTLAFLLVSAGLNWIPVIGPFLASALLPALSVGLMQACAETAAGHEVRPNLLFWGLLGKPAAMIRLGLLYLGAMLLTLAAASPVDDGALLHQMLFGTPPPDDAVKDGSYLNALALAGLLATPVLMSFWFAPVLVAWRGLGTAQSLFYSFFACLRNWRVFGIYGLLMFGGVMTASMIMAMIGVSMGANLDALRGAMLGLVILMMPTVTASFYQSYLDIFPQQAGDHRDEMGIESSQTDA